MIIEDALVCVFGRFALINAEELNITAKTIDKMKASTCPEIKRFVGTEGNYVEQLGLPKGLGRAHRDWPRTMTININTI